MSRLGGEVESIAGRRNEKHIITQPTAVVVPAGLPHNPLTITKVDKPFILLDCRPFGHGVVERPRKKSMFLKLDEF